MTYQGYNGTPPGPYLFFGGYDPATHLLSNSTWLVNTSGAVPVCPSGGCVAPSPRWGAIFFNLDPGTAILYGGCGGAPTVGAYGQLICSSGQLESDIWVFEYNYSLPTASTWVKENCQGVTHPTTPLAQGVGEGIVTNLGMMAGGETANGSASPQTWVVSNYTLSAGCTPYNLVWTSIGAMPNPEIGGAIVGPLNVPATSVFYDIEYGGVGAIGHSPNGLGNRFEVNVSQCQGILCAPYSTWYPLSAGGSNPPTYSGAALTKVLGRYYLFGGVDGSPASSLTWFSSPSGPTGWGVDSNLTLSPSARAYGGYATGWTLSGVAELVLCGGMATTSPLTAASGCWWFG